MPMIGKRLSVRLGSEGGHPVRLDQRGLVRFAVPTPTPCMAFLAPGEFSSQHILL